MDKEMFNFYKHALQGVLTNPLCAEYQTEWRKCGEDKEQLINLALRQQSLPYLITHCYKGKGVTESYIKSTFKDYINGAYTAKDVEGVVGYTYNLNVGLNDVFGVSTDVSAYLWCKGLELTIPETKCPTIYIGCKSNVHLTLGGYNNIRIYLFDESKMTIDEMDEVSKVLVYKYSPKASVAEGKFCFGEVKVFDKPLRL